MTWGSSTRHALAAAGLVLALAACVEPALPDGEVGEGAQRPLETRPPDPGREALQAELAGLVATVEGARDRLVAATEADALSAATAAGDEALDLLLVDPDGAPTETAPLFPAVSAERGVDDARDSGLVAALTIAREAGELGRRTADVLGDVAGDLGSWQRDAEGMVASVRAAVQGPADLDQLESAVLELPGDGTRALAWTMLVTDAGSVEEAAAYAERGVAHLDLVLAALNTLDPASGEPDGGDETGGGEQAGDGA